jgi:hypothetical protein
MEVKQMLYRLSKDLCELSPLPFSDFTRYQKQEKHLEELLSKHLFDTLFEGTPLLPFHQERSYQPEGDIYALNASGDIVIFELKVSTAGDTALDQLLRYVQVAGQWRHGEIDHKFRAYPKQIYGDVDVAEAHRDAFGLTEQLMPEDFNRSQHMVVVGSAADVDLVRAVDYWKGKGLSIDFCPYRIFEIHSEPYFEFFAKPYDDHTNPGQTKGVLFDTNRKYYPQALQLMIEKRRIAAYGDRADAVDSLAKNDIVFYSHKWVGLIAAAKIIGSKIKTDNTVGEEERYWDVEFLTPPPTQFDSFPNAMSFQKVKEVTGKNFFWARIQKVPYLTKSEAEHLLEELRKCLVG